LADVFRNLDWSMLTDALLTVIPALICIIFHEVSHGYVAYRLGDNTAKNMGRLTFNPIKHLDIVGLLAMMFLHFGWAKPVPIEPGNFKNPKRGMAITALAGPVSNMLLAIAALFLLGLLKLPFINNVVGYYVLVMIQKVSMLSVWLGIFNILPIPPMDGSKVFFAIASDRTYFKLMRYERYGLIIILLLSVSGRLWAPMNVAFNFVYEKLWLFEQAGEKLVSLLL
jgi:Zn-dependent protease